MSVDIGEAIQEGIERTVAQNGLYLVAITFVIGLLNGLVSSSLTRELVRSMQTGPGQVPVDPTGGAPTLGLSPAVAGLLSILLAIASAVVTVGAIRTFVTGETERLLEERFTRNILLVLVNLVIGGIIFSVVVTIGFVLLVVPGVFLLVSLYFWTVFVVVEDENFIDAFGSAWALARGNRLVLFLLGLVVWVVAIVVSIVFGIPTAILPGALGFVVNQLGSAFVGVFILATTARAYVQLAGGAARAEPEGAGAGPDESEFEFDAE